MIVEKEEGEQGSWDTRYFNHDLSEPERLDYFGIQIGIDDNGNSSIPFMSKPAKSPRDFDIQSSA